MGIMFVQCDKQQSQKTIKNRTVWARLKLVGNLSQEPWLVKLEHAILQ